MGSNLNWKNVSKSHPCPICQHADWCSYSLDGEMCLCQRVESKHPAKSGQGFIHILRQREWTAPVRERKWSAPVKRMFNAEKVMKGFRKEFEGDGLKTDIFDSLIAIGKDLNLKPGDVDRLLVGRSKYHMSWCFPMRDGAGNVVGIRLRRYNSSDKFSVSGSQDGLFYDPALEAVDKEVYIVEGATDTIAGYAIGLPCVGRSSCNTGTKHLRELCNRLFVRRVTIIADYDEPKTRPNGDVYYPGLDGAKALAKHLGRMYRIVTPPTEFKDLRDWYCKGALALDVFNNTLSCMKWRTP